MFDSLGNQSGVGGLELGTGIFGHLQVALTVVLQTVIPQDLDGIVVSLHEVDRADGVVRLGILWINLDDLHLVLLGLDRLLDVAIDGSKLLQ